MIEFTGERIVPEANNFELQLSEKMYQEHVARYAFSAQWIKGRRVLDVGCGVGYGSRWLAENGAESVLAFDPSTAAIEHARRIYHHSQLNFVVASATEFNFDEQFDVVTCFELIGHVEEQRTVIQCIRRALKEDGILIISTPRALETKRIDFHTREFLEEEFKELLLGEFPQVKFYFENTHFSTLITDRKLSILSNILAIHDQYPLDQADYLIAVASPSSIKNIVEDAQPVIVFGDNEYVALLERNVATLQNAEINLNAERDTLRNEMSNLVEVKSVLQTEMDSLRSQLVHLQKNEASLILERKTLQIENSNVISEKLVLSADLDVVRNKAQKTHENQAALILERNVLLNDNEYFKDFVAQIQKSISWQVTAPLRSIGSKIYVPIRMARKVREYQAQHGIRALLKAIQRRLGREKWYASQLPISKFDYAMTGNTAIGQFDVVFAIGCWEGESKRYRVLNIAEGLTKIGYKVKVIPFEHIASIVSDKVEVKVVVLFRATINGAVGINEFLLHAKCNNIKVVYDVDDLIFEPEIVDQIDGFRVLSQRQQNDYLRDLDNYRKLLVASDAVSVPTEYLKIRVEALGKKAFVIPNTINDAQFAIATQLESEKRVQNGYIRIGYFSGSRTHQADFDECANALFSVMGLNANVSLRIVGFLELDVRWQQFSNRIERMDFQPYQAMLRVLYECDINIAPLQIASVFCQGKSELKFFEAGLLGIPTIASATDTYLRIIENGVNGYRVAGQEEWLSALNALTASASLRKMIGEKAKETSVELYSVHHIAKMAAEIYGLEQSPSAAIPELMNSSVVPNKLHIAWVIPGLIIGGGGHRNILRAAYFLSQFGHQITLYFTGTEQDPQTIRNQIQQHFYPLDCAIFLYDGQIKRADVVLATHWTTVSAALTARGIAREIMYFVQDFEPAFAPMSTEYVLAENTYRLGLYHITSGPWCEVMLRRDYQADADHFQFPVDRSIYYPRTRTKPNKNIIFFAKPEMPRRCFELGVMALSAFHRLCPNVEIIMFGSKNAGKQSYDFPATIRDLVPTLDNLAEMYSNGDVGLVFSTTNPSLIPYEMMACGLPIVDLDRGDNIVNYDNRSDIAFLANPLPEEMARQISQLIGNPKDLEQRSTNGIDFISQFPSEEEMAKRVEYLILNRISKFY